MKTTIEEIATQTWRDDEPVAKAAAQVAQAFLWLQEYYGEEAWNFYEWAAPRIKDDLNDTRMLRKYELDDFFPKMNGIIPKTTILERLDEIRGDCEQEFCDL